MIGDHGKEFGSTTGRRRQCNYLNLDNLLTSLYINNCNICIVNKVDILKDLGIFKVISKGEIITFSNWNEMKEYIMEYCEKVIFVFSESPNHI